MLDSLKVFLIDCFFIESTEHSVFEAPSAIEDGNGTEEAENTQVNSDVEADVNFNRESIGKRAIEDLASQLNKAANTIRDFSQNVSLVF